MTSFAELRATAVKHPALARGSHGAPIPGPVVICIQLLKEILTHHRIRVLVTVTKSEDGAAGARLEVLLSHGRGRAIAKESILLIELLPLLAATSTEALG